MLKRTVLFLMIIMIGFIVIDCGKNNPTKSKKQTVTVDEDGGTLEINNESSPIYGASIDIPEGRLEQKVEIELTIPDTSYTIGYETPIIVEILPSGLQFKEPVTIGLPWNTNNLNANNLAAYYFNPENNSIETLDIESIDTQNKITYATIHHTSSYYSGSNINKLQVNGYKIGSYYSAIVDYQTPMDQVSLPTLCIYNSISEVLETSYVNDIRCVLYLSASLYKDKFIGIEEMFIKEIWMLVETTSMHTFRYDLTIYEKDPNSSWFNADLSKIAEVKNISQEDLKNIWLPGKPFIFHFNEYNNFDPSDYFIGGRWQPIDVADDDINTKIGAFTFGLSYTMDEKCSEITATNVGDENKNGILDLYDPEMQNNPPNSPSSPTPSNRATNVSTNTSLSWSCSDPDGDNLTYDIYFGKSASPSKVKSNSSSTSYSPGQLDHNTKYYWKIKASDGEEQTMGSTWYFTTQDEPITNNPPNSPSSPSPSDGATNISTNISLSWSCSDPDGDNLTYDVYFGKSASPSKVKSNNSSTRYSPGQLDYSTKYYWKIVASDGEEQTPGDTWYFTTEDEGNNDPDNLNIDIISPEHLSTVTGTIDIIGETSGDIGVVILELDNIGGIAADTAVIDHQFSFSLNTNELSDGEHFIIVTGYDEDSNEVSDVITVTVDNSGGGGTGECTDIDGNTYQTVIIGNQEWMAENLKVTHYRNGDAISDCWAYDNDESNVSTYGRLYSWYAVSDSRNIAPAGWHVPTDEEWEELAQYISDQNGGYSKSGDDWYNVGTHLKATSGWNSGGNGTDDYGFAALPAGYRDSYGSFSDMGRYTNFWSATEHGSDTAWNRGLAYDYTLFTRYNRNKGRGFSVRLLRD